MIKDENHIIINSTLTESEMRQISNRDYTMQDEQNKLEIFLKEANIEFDRNYVRMEKGPRPFFYKALILSYQLRLTVKLLVNGDSMEELFHDGDIVEYHPQPELENGEIGVFAINGGVTMKKFKRNSDIRLESLNKKYQDIVIKETDDFNILGKVIL